MELPQWTPEGWYEAARAESAARAERLQRNARVTFDLYRKTLPHQTDQEITALLARNNEERLADVPSFTRYPELRGMPALIRAQWEGMRDGACLSDDLWHAIVNGIYLYSRRLLQNLRPPATQDPGRCTYVYFPESEYGPLLANNLDSNPAEDHSEPSSCKLNEHLLWGQVSSGVFLDETSPESFPVPVKRLLARYARTRDEAVELLIRYNHFWGPTNGIVIDRSHRAAIIEKSACRYGLRLTEGATFVTSMTAEEPGFRAYLDDRRNASLIARGLTAPCADTYYWGEADHRRHLLQRLVADAQKNPSLESIRRIIQYREADGRVAYNADVLRPGASPTLYTLRSTIWILKENRAYWWRREGDTPSFEAPRREIEYPGEIPWGD